MRRLINRGGHSKTSRRSALIAENNASKIRKMILDELDTAIGNAQNATVDEGEKDSIAFSVNISDNEKIRFQEKRIDLRISLHSGMETMQEYISLCQERLK